MYALQAGVTNILGHSLLSVVSGFITKKTLENFTKRQRKVRSGGRSGNLVVVYTTGTPSESHISGTQGHANEAAPQPQLHEPQLPEHTRASQPKRAVF